MDGKRTSTWISATLVHQDSPLQCVTVRLARADPAESIFGRPDLATISRAFGLQATTVKSLPELKDAIAWHVNGSGSTVIDIHIDGNIPSIQYRRLFFGEASTGH